ncbi:DUF6653 family protein [Litoreibacter roseus]|uniref:Uncharacterized protein n=1 Tax=Litoreibacter roseus TaxID=2601869 RepID=A0A6N6JCC2_9RHOB|nr:DUF6653 family protein [Litoreibacter roseus]GFE63973.1 hypothetical protein KIN_10470 [Litoreibacter roseus]
MNIFNAAERLMAMDDVTWRRHANPWSVWTRFTCLPLIVLALWSRAVFGWWSLVLLALSLIWTWANPRAFPPPSDYGSWGSRAVLGERIFLAKDRYTIAPHHLKAANWLTIASAVGMLPLLYGIIYLDALATLFGLFATVGPKVWFCDRMVWIHADLTATEPGTPLSDPTLPPAKGTTHDT